MRIDVFATERHFVDHLAPVWRALPRELRGDVIVPRPLVAHAKGRGLPASPERADPAHPVLVAAYGDVKRMRLAGRHRIAFIEHGIGQSYAGDHRSATHGSYAGGKDRGDVGLFLVPNERAAARWRAAYPDARVEAVGCPKLDTLPGRDESPGPVVAFAFHWEATLVQETRSAFPYYRPALAPVAGRWATIGHGHPRAFDGPPRLRRWYARQRIEVVEDFADVCRRADVYVCDNSSSMYEFAATGRPVVVLNEPTGRVTGRGYRREIDHGLRFWEAADVGPNAWKPDDVPAAIERALERRPSDVAARETALDIVYAHRTGAAERAAEALVEWSVGAKARAA